MRAINNIVIHCTAGPQNQSIESIKSYWKNELGWKNPGYHYMIQADGHVAVTLPISQIANGVAGHNQDAIHISYLGGVEIIAGKNSKGQPINTIGRPIDNRTPEQKFMLEILVRAFHGMFPKAAIKGHRDFSPDKNKNGIIEPNEWVKSCPSFDVAEWLKEIEL